MGSKNAHVSGDDRRKGGLGAADRNKGDALSRVKVKLYDYCIPHAQNGRVSARGVPGRGVLVRSPSPGHPGAMATRSTRVSEPRNNRR